MSDARQRLLDAIELETALASKVGTVDEGAILSALEKAREEMREAAREYVAAKQETKS